MTGDCRLLVDVGGTNVRFGLARNGTVDKNIITKRVCEFVTFEAALSHALENLPRSQRISSVAVAAAGPTTENEIQLTNTSWVVSATDIHKAIGGDPAIYLMNDLEAVAHALPHLPARDVNWIKGATGKTSSVGRKLVINVGTGFGSATLIETPAAKVVCPSEAGHMLLGAASLADLELFANVTCGPITTESILSGNGVQQLAKAINAGRHHPIASEAEADPIDMPAIDLANRDPLAQATSRLVTRFLAEAAANLTLAVTAWDGVFLCGSVATAWARSADLREFETAFTGEAPMHLMLAATPVGVIVDPLPSFLGLANFNP